MKKAQEWANNEAWRNGFTKAQPHESVNLTDFYVNYNKCPEVWQTLFNWLQTTDLENIPKGKHLIPNSQLIASVEDSYNDVLSKRQSESHHYNIDFMLVVKGTEGFKILDHNTSTLSTKYKYDVVRYKYEPDACKTLEVPSGEFVIFFPDDWHVAKVSTSLKDQNIRVIVVKMPVIL